MKSLLCTLAAATLVVAGAIRATAFTPERARPPLVVTLSATATSVPEKLAQLTQARHHRTQTVAHSSSPLQQFPASLERFFNNPPALGATIAAVVALLSFFFNWRATLRGQADARQNQRDLQLYEALKRFGDESPALRTSAAGLVAYCGSVSRRGSAAPMNFHTAVTQLTDGLRLEQDTRVRQAIVDALKRLAALNPESVVQVLYQANLTLQRDAIEALARACLAQEVSALSDCEGLAEQFAPALGVEATLLRGLMGDRPPWMITFLSKEFSRAFEAEKAINRTISTADATEQMQIAFGRLDSNATALAWAIRMGTERVPPQAFRFALRFLLTHPFSIGRFRLRPAPRLRTRLFLPDVWLAGKDISRCDLRRAILSLAKLQKAKLLGADLRSTDLRFSHLEGASLARARLNNALLYGAHINIDDPGPGLVEDGVSYFGAGNWWTANFNSEETKTDAKVENDRESIDVKLVTALAKSDVPGAFHVDLSNAHPSVRIGLGEKRVPQPPAG